jgi:hypothetical protein
VAERIGSFDDCYPLREPVRLAWATTMSVPLAEEIAQAAFLSAYRQSSRIDLPEARLRRAVESGPRRPSRSKQSRDSSSPPSSGYLQAASIAVPQVLQGSHWATDPRSDAMCPHSSHPGNRRLLL